MSFSEHLEKIIKEAHYRKGHEGDPQYTEYDSMVIRLPKGYFGIEIHDASGEKVDGAGLVSKDLFSRFYEENGMDQREFAEWVNFLKKDVKNQMGWLAKTFEESKEDYPKPWTIDLRREDEVVEGSEFKIDPDNADLQQIQKLLEDKLAVALKEYVDNPENAEVEEPEPPTPDYF